MNKTNDNNTILMIIVLVIVIRMIIIDDDTTIRLNNETNVRIRASIGAENCMK